MGFLLYPFLVVLFWYKDGLFSLLSYFRSLDDYLIRLFSLPGMFATYFKPLKNEYRKNLILFSILFGMVIKFLFIIAALIILSLVLIFEGIIFVVYLTFPILPFILFFK